MPAMKCPHCAAVTEFTSVPENQTIVCEQCGKSVRIKESARNGASSASSRGGAVPVVADPGKPATVKADSAKPSLASKSNLPDFSALAATSTAAPATGVPDFAGLNIKTRPAATTKRPATPVAASDRVAVPGKVAASGKVSDSDKASDSGKVAAADKVSDSDKVAATDKVSTDRPKDAAAVAKPQPTEKKAGAPADDLLGFREFAAIAGVTSSPAPTGVVDIPFSALAAKPAGAAGEGSEIVESVTASKSSEATSSDPLAKSARLFGYTWIPVVANAAAWLLFATALYAIYGVFSGTASAFAGTVTSAAMLAAGAAMLALGLAVRLLSQIAASLTQRKLD